MPTYEYKCSHCGHAFEAFQKMTEKPIDNCPKCHKGTKRLIGSGSGIIFKGAGFYVNDYRKKSKSEEPKVKANTCPKAKEGCNACEQPQ